MENTLTPYNAPDQEATEMSLMDHLAELRTRVIISLVALIVGAIISYQYSSVVFAYLNAPYHEAFPNQLLIGTGPADGFLIRIKVALFSGAILVSPILFAQVWLFVTPGLYANERRLLIPFVLVTTILFVIGVYFCYRAILPISYAFFSNEYKAIGVTPSIKIDENLSLVITTLLGFGVVFEMPVLAFFLGRIGLITHHSLISAGRYAVVLIFIISAILTPPDVLSQFLMAGPLLLLYGLSILIVKFTAVPAISTPAEGQTI